MQTINTIYNLNVYIIFRKNTDVKLLKPNIKAAWSGPPSGNIVNSVPRPSAFHTPAAVKYIAFYLALYYITEMSFCKSIPNKYRFNKHLQFKSKTESSHEVCMIINYWFPFIENQNKTNKNTVWEYLLVFLSSSVARIKETLDEKINTRVYQNLVK